MDKEEAIKRLWARAWHNMEKCHLHNLSNPFPQQKKCLICGGQGMEQEKKLKQHVFCNVRCQERLWGLDHYLSLGMIRGFDAVREIVVPNIRFKDLPEEIILQLFDLAYGFRLYSIEELEEVLAMRTVSKEFQDLIDTMVIPNIKFLAGEILSKISEDVLRLFTGLESFMFGGLVNGREPLFPRLSQWVWAMMHNLRVLHLANNAIFPLSFTGFGRLQTLRLNNVSAHDSDMQKLISVTDLSIRSCPMLSNECLLPLTRLRRLELQNLSNFRGIDMCTTLRTLKIWHDVWIQDIGLEDLTALTSLSLPGRGGGMREIGNDLFLGLHNLSFLDLTDNKDITDEALTDLVTLKRLIIGGETEISIGAVLLLTSLTALDLSDREDADEFVPSLSLLVNLRELNLEGTELNIVGLPPQLTFLSLNEQVGFNSSIVTSLANLRHLCLTNCRMLRDEHMLMLPFLLSLDLSENNFITNEGVEGLLLLQELVLTDNFMITYRAVKKLHALTHLVAVRCLLLHTQITELRKQNVRVIDEHSVEDLDQYPPHYRKFS